MSTQTSWDFDNLKPSWRVILSPLFSRRRWRNWMNEYILRFVLKCWGKLHVPNDKINPLLKGWSGFLGDSNTLRVMNEKFSNICIRPDPLYDFHNLISPFLLKFLLQAKWFGFSFCLMFSPHFEVVAFYFSPPSFYWPLWGLFTLSHSAFD